MGFFRSDEDEASEGVGDGNWLLPVPAQILPNLGEIVPANPKDDPLGPQMIRMSPLQKLGVFPQGARADVIEGSNLLPELLVSPD